MKYLLDTCVISEPGKATPNKHVLGWLQGQDEEACFLSVLTIGEIQKGIAKLTPGKRRDAIQRWLDLDLRGRFSERLLPIDEEVALTWGLVQGEAERRGTRIPTIDGLIAATAIAHNLVLVTRNDEHIRQTGVRVLNPWDPASDG
jgi:predicted nucleic acid-binding protein